AGALILSVLRGWGGDSWASPNWPPVWNATFLAHLLTVAAIVAAGQLALSLRGDQLLTTKPEVLRAVLWILASQTLSVLLWREPSGLWPAGLLSAQVLGLGALSRLIVSPTVSGTAGVVLLFVLSQGWTRYQNALLQDAKPGASRRGLRSEIRWRTQVGLSVLWTLYAAAVLAWGFLRRSAPLRYGALGLLGL